MLKNELAFLGDVLSPGDTFSNVNLLSPTPDANMCAPRSSIWGGCCLQTDLQHQQVQACHVNLILYLLLLLHQITLAITLTKPVVKGSDEKKHALQI